MCADRPEFSKQGHLAEDNSQRSAPQGASPLRTDQNLAGAQDEPGFGGAASQAQRPVASDPVANMRTLASEG